MSYIKKSFSTFGTQIVLIVLGILSSILIARILGPELNGKVIILITAINLLFMIGNLGLGSSFTYYIAKGKHKSEEIISFSFIISILLGVVMVGLFFLTYRYHVSFWDKISFDLILLSIFLVPLYILNNNLLRVIMGFNKIYELNICNLIRSVGNLLSLIVLVWYLKKGITGVLIAIYISSVITFFSMCFVLRKKIKPSFSISFDLIRNCLNYGIKTYMILLINFLNYRADLFLLKHFRSDLDVGYYSLAVGIAELIWIVPNSTVSTLFPTIAASDKIDRSIVTLRTCRWSLLIMFFVSIACLLLGKIAIELLYGKAYLPSYSPLVYMLPGIFLFPIYKLLIIDLAARGHPGYGTIASLVALIINIVLNILLIPNFGTVGAAVSTSVSYGIMSLMSLYFFMSITGHSVKEVFLIPEEERKFVVHKLSSYIAKVAAK